MLFFACGLKRWAHGPLADFATDSHAIAGLDGTRPAALARIGKFRRNGLGGVSGPIAQVLGHRRRIDDLAGIHQLIGIERLLDFAESAVQLLANNLLVEA